MLLVSSWVERTFGVPNWSQCSLFSDFSIPVRLAMFITGSRPTWRPTKQRMLVCVDRSPSLITYMLHKVEKRHVKGQAASRHLRGQRTMNTYRVATSTHHQSKRREQSKICDETRRDETRRIDGVNEETRRDPALENSHTHAHTHSLSISQLANSLVTSLLPSSRLISSFGSSRLLVGCFYSGYMQN
jgi:hypothetical protein